MKEDKIICEEVSNNGWNCKVRYKNSDESPPNVKWDPHLWEYLEFSAYIDPNLDDSRDNAMRVIVKSLEEIMKEKNTGIKDMKPIIPGLSIFTQISKTPLFSGKKRFFSRKHKLKGYKIDFKNEMGLVYREGKKFFRENVFGDYKWFAIPFYFSYEDPREIRIYYEYQKGPKNIPVHDANKTIEEILKNFKKEKEFSILGLNNAAHDLDLQEYAIGGSSRCNAHANEIWSYACDNSRFNWNSQVKPGTPGFKDYQAMIIASQINRLGKEFGVSGDLVYNLIKNNDPKYKGFIHSGFFSKQVEEQLTNEDLRNRIVKEDV